MGKVLQIRVSAWTYSEDEVAKVWPSLSSLVWPESDQWSPPGGARGVLELADALPDVARFGDLPDNVRLVLQNAVADVAAPLTAMRQALEAWNPREANAASDRLEEALGALENTLREELVRTDGALPAKSKKGMRFWR